ncbi:MAG: SRPBCC family protein [Gemmatimonadales bacterium]
MERQDRLIGGIILGAGAMYLLDPARGARRRSLLRDRIVHTGNKLGDGLSATARDTRNRAVGAAASLRSRLKNDQADDAVLHERVRSAIGRVVSHPGAITVNVLNGQVTLSGDVLADEVDDLIGRVREVRGVKEVRNELQVHSSADGVPALQGSGRPREQRPELLQENWAPAIRLVTGTIGGLMVLKGVRTRGPARNALTAAGFGLLTRALTNLPARRLVGAGAGRRAVDVQKTITVAAPVERVWELWSNFEQFPRFMSHLREVRRIDDTRSHWVAAGPAGVPIEWDAVVTQRVLNEAIAWKSVEGSTVETAGRVRFRPTPEGNTEIDVQMSYNPPAGALGHAVASLFGADPKRAMDEDMVRLKSLLEEGKTRADGEPVHLDDVISSAPSPNLSTPRRRSRP